VVYVHFNNHHGILIRRNNFSCSPISTSMLPWVSEIRYLVKKSTNFKCSIDHAKKDLSIDQPMLYLVELGESPLKILLDITSQLINTKCIPILLYGLEACPLLKSDLSAIEFVISRLFMKLFRTSNIDVVKCCQEHFGFKCPSVIWSKRVKKFEAKLFLACNNLLCKIIQC